MNQKCRVIKFPKRGRFAEQRRQPMTPERQALGQEWLERLREILEEGRL